MEIEGIYYTLVTNQVGWKDNFDSFMLHSISLYYIGYCHHTWPQSIILQCSFYFQTRMNEDGMDTMAEYMEDMQNGNY